ncbi:hypothetical protein [Thioclava sp. GXIMD4216]|uniref:Uncharacterized protein n=1 Tax=Thioclava litoralis TaxID=3076557 RepID=A0ABZ1E0X1_9RHOB|nr:hypothetical protein RPE78_05335 [Thioclava sp. FTW29]
MSWGGLIFLMVLGCAVSLVGQLYVWGKGTTRARDEDYEAGITRIGVASLGGAILFVFLLAIGVDRVMPLASYMAFATGICITLVIAWADTRQTMNERNYDLGMKYDVVMFVVAAMHVVFGVMMGSFGWNFDMLSLIFVELVVVLVSVIFRSVVRAATSGAEEHAH